MPAISGHGELFERGLLRQPFAEVEVHHHLGDELLRCLTQCDLFGLGEALALALPDPLAFARDRLHALLQSPGCKQRHDQRVGGRACGDGGEQHRHKARVVELGDQKFNHAAPSEIEVDHFLHHEDAHGHPHCGANEHQLTGRMSPQQRDIVGARQVDEQHDDGRQCTDDAR